MRDDHAMKTQKISVTIPENLLDHVRKMAASEKRSVSNMLSKIIAEAVKNKAA